MHLKNNKGAGEAQQLQALIDPLGEPNSISSTRMMGHNCNSRPKGPYAPTSGLLQEMHRYTCKRNTHANKNLTKKTWKHFESFQHKEMEK